MKSVKAFHPGFVTAPGVIVNQEFRENWSSLGKQRRKRCKLLPVAIFPHKEAKLKEALKGHQDFERKELEQKP